MIHKSRLDLTTGPKDEQNKSLLHSRDHFYLIRGGTGEEAGSAKHVRRHPGKKRSIYRLCIVLRHSASFRSSFFNYVLLTST